MGQQANVPSAEVKASGAPYRADIDGLRAIAVLSVLFYHAGFPGFRGGLTGVDTFFVISGFLIGGHIHDEESAGHFTFGGFYLRRAKRILPALYAVVLAVLLLGSILLSPRELERAATEGMATLLSCSNLFYWKVTNYFAVSADQRTLLMTWSLGVEEQFYLVVPWLMIFFLRKKLSLLSAIAILCALSFGFACYQTTHTPTAAFYLLPARGWELLAGVLVALLTTSKRPPARVPIPTQHGLALLGVALVVLPICLLTNTIPFPGIGALPSVLGSALLLCCPSAWINRAILSQAPLRHIGRISYSLYLWHWPLLTFARVVLGTGLTRTQGGAILILSLLLAEATYRWVEQPFRRSQTPGRALLLRYGTATLSLLLACAALRATYGLAFRSPGLATEEKLATLADDPCFISSPDWTSRTTSRCIEDSGRPAIVLWGDSHAESLATALRQQSHASGYDFSEAVKGSCPPLANTGRFLRDSPGYARECIAHNNAVLKRLLEEKRIHTIILASYWQSPLVDPYSKDTGWLVNSETINAGKPSRHASEFELSDSLAGTITALQAAGKRVIVLQDVPVFATEPLWRLRTSHLAARGWIVHHLAPRSSIDPGNDAEMDIAADSVSRSIVASASQSTNATLFDLKQPLCASPSACSYRDEDHIFYADNQHLTISGAQAVLRNLHLGKIP